MFKKFLCVGMTGIITVSMLAACGNSNSSGNAAADAGTSETVEESSDGGSEGGADDGSYEAFAGASGEIPEEYQGREVVDYWYPWGGDSETWDQWRMEEFNKSQDQYYIRGQYVPEGSGVTNGKLQAAITSGEVPDVILSDNPMATYTLAANGGFQPINDALEKSGFDFDAVNQAVFPLMEFDGQYYLYPANTDAVILFIRNDMAEEAGLDLNNPPKTIDELDQWADAMTKINDDGSIDCYGFIPWIDGGEMTTWGVQFGATVYDTATGTYDVNTPEMQAIYEWMRTYSDKFDTDILTGFTNNLGGAFSPDHAFFTGDVGMTVCGNWFCEAIHEYAPDIDYTIAPVPAATEALYGGTPLTGNALAVPVGADNVDGAIAWCNFIQKAEMQEANNKTWLSLGIFPEDCKELSRYKENDPAEMLVVDVTFNPNSRFFCVSPKTNELNDALKTIVDQAVYTKDDIGQALDKLTSDLND